MAKASDDLPPGDENTNRQYGIRAKLAQIAEGLLRKIGNSPPSPHEHAAQCLSAMHKRAMSALNSLTVLNEESPHDHHHDGAVILRALYDVHLQALYMLQEPETRSRLYSDFLAVQVYDLLRAADKNPSDIGEAVRSSLLRPYFVQNVMTNYTAVRSQFLTRKGNACRDNWYPGKLADLAKAAGYLPEYELMQRSLSNSVHSTPFGLLFGAGVTDSLLLNYAWVLNFRIIGGIARHVGVPLDEFEAWATTYCQRSLGDYPLSP